MKEGSERRPLWRVDGILRLGATAGVFAAVVTLPTIIPLNWQLGVTEDANDLRRARAANRAVVALYEAEVPLAESLTAELDIDAVLVRDAAEQAVVSAGRFTERVNPPDICPVRGEASRTVVDHDGRWVLTCRTIARGTVLTAQLRTADTTNHVGYMVSAIAVMVGIITALAVMRYVSNYASMSTTLQRIENGERGVRFSLTGYEELDALVDHLNAVTRAVEDREDGILSRIEVVQQLARMVAHEIRNPLQSLELLASLIASEDDRPEREHLARSIQDEVRTLENVVVRLLRDAPGQAALRPNRQPTRVRELLQHVITLRAPAARRRGVTLELAEAPDISIPLDRALISRAIENLVLNAMEAVPQGSGRVRLCAKVIDKTVELRVEDNGPGVDPALGMTIYQTNTTTKDNGHGIGLALVRGVMLAHEGYVTHDRSELGGAVFVCSMPIVLDAAKEGGRADPGGG